MPPEKWAAAVPIGAIVVSRSSSSGRAVPRDICLPDSAIVPVLVVALANLPEVILSINVGRCRRREEVATVAKEASWTCRASYNFVLS